MSREALRGSIQKWIDIRDNGGVDNGRANCPLCEEYNYYPTPCLGCPVAHREPDSFIRFCHETPYDDWLWLKSIEGASRIFSLMDAANPVEAQAVADRMVKFLESLEGRYVEA